MTAENGASEKNDEGKSVLVAIRMDNSGHELLNWALVKVALPGDRVLAVHVVRTPDGCSREDPPDLSTEKALDGYLAVYDGFCTLKKVDLVGEVSRGNSIRRAIILKAKACAATTVVVGFNRNNSLGVTNSLVKQCARKLPQSTTLLGIQNGKVRFRSNGLESDSKSGFYSLLLMKRINSNQKGKPDRRVPEGSPTENECACEFRNSAQEEKVHVKKSSEDDIETLSSCTSLNICEFEPSEVANADPFHHSRQQTTKASSYFSSLPRKLPETTIPGWPLLRKASSAAVEAFGDSEGRNLSVVQWAMNLPNRSVPTTPQSPTHPNKLKNSKNRRFFKSDDGVYRNFSLVEQIKELETILESNKSDCRWFSYTELQSCTAQFSSESLIGMGGCSRVYKGLLQNGKPIAVKISKSSKQAWKDFLLEMDIITSLQHENIVSLIGVCVKDCDPISVYSFMSRRTLEENLHCQGEKSVLPWDVRFKAAVGISRALSYLHGGCSRPVIHRDVKSSNILFSDNFEPLLSDFGLALWAPITSIAATHCDVLGTFGYLAPEYFMYGKVSDKIDVYSFGVVLLELLSGRRPISTESPKGKESLVMWAMPILEKGDVQNLLDPNLGKDLDKDQIQRMIAVASLCLRRRANLRPSMCEVLRLLEGEMDLKDWLESKAASPGQADEQDEEEEAFPNPGSNSRLNLSFLEEDDDIISHSSIEQTSHHTFEYYLQRRCGRSSSFD
ncbi:protein kinase STUNTED-like isoform X2 [Aristolochia californica]|uniref:protein kinase STUNTED-like isoform X2 n=1 Tax=Aristolochia californica TaxID=171875 RepID=UPI0035DB2BBD